MKEETIEKVFSCRDWNDSICDSCCEYTGAVLIGDERACHNCLLTQYDESGEKWSFEKAFTPQPKEPDLLNLKGTIHEFIINTLSDTPRKIALLFLAAVIPALVLGSLLFTESEVAAYTAAVLGGGR